MTLEITPKKTLRFVLLGTAVLALVSWTPPANDSNIIMPTGKVSLSAGALESKPGTSAANALSTLPALVLGSGNRTDATGTGSPSNAVASQGQGMVIGSNNNFGTPLGGTGNWRAYGAVIGEANRSSVRSSLVVGYGNISTPAAAHVDDALNWSLVVGYENTGNLANSSLVVGYSNTMGRCSPSTLRTNSSVALGSGNGIFSDMGWAMGYMGIVKANRGVAIGTGTKVETADCTALGRYNDTTEQNDVLVVGSGDTNETRSTALRVTNSGGVVLGSPTGGKVVLAQAQGDIAMGIYGAE
jgi:hypothetical protein